MLYKQEAERLLLLVLGKQISVGWRRLKEHLQIQGHRRRIVSICLTRSESSATKKVLWISYNSWFVGLRAVSNWSKKSNNHGKPIAEAVPSTHSQPPTPILSLCWNDLFAMVSLILDYWIIPCGFAQQMKWLTDTCRNPTMRLVVQRITDAMAWHVSQIQQILMISTKVAIYFRHETRDFLHAQNRKRCRMPF